MARQGGQAPRPCADLGDLRRYGCAAAVHAWNTPLDLLQRSGQAYAGLDWPRRAAGEACAYAFHRVGPLALREAERGDEQARQTPLRSDLSISGILKHLAWIMSSALGRTSEPGSPEGFAEFADSFRPHEDETLDLLLERFDESRTAYVTARTAINPEGTSLIGPRPWDDIFEPIEASNRLEFAHHLAEFARHAGHADVIREQIDRAQALELRFAVEGRPGNAYVQPWT